jgi:large subunit ribosomal protein L2
MKTYKAVTPSLRHRSIIEHKYLWKGKPEKSLTIGKKRTGGRNNSGRITVFHRGGGHKRKYRIVDFKRLDSRILFKSNSLDNPKTELLNKNVVERIEYDPNRTAFLALLSNQGKAEGHDVKSYILAAESLKKGDVLDNKSISSGNCLYLKDIPIGTDIYNIELRPGQGGKLIRAAGTSAKLIQKKFFNNVNLLEQEESDKFGDFFQNSRPVVGGLEFKGGRKKLIKGFAIVKLQSGKLKTLSLYCKATIGSVSNEFHHIENLGKAGASIWKGKKPHVRGVAMNPIDHPHGGGEGKASGGRPSVTPWGVPTKGFKTRRFKAFK